MSQTQKIIDFDKLAKIVDDNYKRPQYWGTILWLFIFLLVVFIAILTVLQIISIGIQTGLLSIDATVTAIIALLVLMISVSQYTGKSNEIDDDEFVADCIEKNLKLIEKTPQKLTTEEKLVISALIKMKVRNSEVKIKDVIQYYSEKPEVWIAFLYGIGDGSELLKK